ncbi:tripartite tricarboxylate transporter TctB family protein [Oxalobacteraceae bacterium R-40]|uniref:Tripartite tricarboxylate transporter TctB family protein n=1 Tax=Keguizhuia sedimenti TaxID=3064264 RepID=A0ABU1BJ09_9BURK|nr:tripartite tricarboxylate transporter TctB family protein [Oxalobacteraceae bacterium R-40]
MSSFIRHSKDFWSGLIFIVAGLAAIYIAQDYSMGTAGRMGPAYFPTVLGALLAIVGLIIFGRSFFGKQEEGVKDFAIKPLILILVAVLVFGYLFRPAGLMVAIPALIFISAVASPKFKVLPTALLAIGLALFSWFLFVKMLGLPLPVLGPWFTGG